MFKYVKVALHGSREIFHDHAEWRFHKEAASILEKIDTMMLATISDQNIKHCDQVLKVGFKSSFVADICCVTMETSSQCTGIGIVHLRKRKAVKIILQILLLLLDKRIHLTQRSCQTFHNELY